MKAIRQSCRRSFVLIAVLVVVGASVLVATSVLFVVQGRVADNASMTDAAKSRALAWSGAQAIMAELNDQRDRLVAGATPKLDRQYTIYETHARAGVVRVLPMNPAGALLQPEAGKIDLNSADADALVKTGVIDSTTAAAIIAFRDQSLHRPFQSVAELLNVPGGLVTPEMLYGPIEQIKTRDQAQLVEGDLAERILDRLQTPSTTALIDLFTVFSVEPNVQSDGRPRINLNQPWSEALEKQLIEQFGQRAADQMKGMIERGLKLENDGQFARMLREADLSPRHWGGALDAFTTSVDENLFGRVDINSATAAALQILPTVTPEQAAELVSLREGMTDEDRANIAWPVLAQIVSRENFEQMAGRITTRCFAYRLRLAAGEVDAENLDGPMANPLIFEMVVDLSSSSPRLAYFRDISVLQAVAQIAMESTLTQPPPDLEAESVASAASDSPSGVEEVAEPPAAADETAPDSSPSPTAAAANEPGASPNPPAEAPVPPARRKVGRWLSGG